MHSLYTKSMLSLEQVAQRAMIAHLRASKSSKYFEVIAKDFSDGQGQLTLQSMLGSGRISNSSET